METYSWWEGPTSGKVEWKYSSLETGAPSLTPSGLLVMQRLSAENWDISNQVLFCIYISLQCTTASAHFYKPIMCINKCVSLLTGVASKHCGKVTCSLITSVFQFRLLGFDTQHIRWKMHFLVRLKLCISLQIMCIPVKAGSFKDTFYYTTYLCLWTVH